MRIASFDIGKKNFAQYIEDFSMDTMNKLKNEYQSLPKKFQRRVKGCMSSNIENILKEIFKDGKRIYTGVYDLRSESIISSSKSVDIQTRKNLFSHLEKFKWLWDTCDSFIIEQQYFRTFASGKRKGGTEANVDAIKMGECTLAWFLINYSSKNIEYFGSQFKTQILGAPLKQTKPQRKNWAIEMTYEIYKTRNDEGALELFDLVKKVKSKRINTEEKVKEYMDTVKSKDKDVLYLSERIIRYRQKLDDISDTCIQLQAYKYRNYVACF